jgi:histidinol phosphatase-like PHP family hydrolase
MMNLVIKKYRNIKVISMSRYAYRRCDKKILELIEKQGIKINIRENLGRPSMVERRIK